MNDAQLIKAVSIIVYTTRQQQKHVLQPIVTTTHPLCHWFINFLGSLFERIRLLCNLVYYDILSLLKRPDFIWQAETPQPLHKIEIWKLMYEAVTC